MADEEWTASDHFDYASARASVIIELAATYESLRDKDMKERLLKTVDLLNEGVERIVRGKGKTATLRAIKGGADPD